MYLCVTVKVMIDGTYKNTRPFGIQHQSSQVDEDFVRYLLLCLSSTARMENTVKN